MKLIPADGLRSMFKNPYKIFAGLTHHGFFARMDDERYLRLLYHGVLGRPLRLNPPVYYSEKLQWLKLHDKNPIYTQLCDKLAVRDFVALRAGKQYLTQLYGIWSSADEIEQEQLPDRFVLKCSHDSGSTILCPDKRAFDFAAARKTIQGKLNRDYSVAGREWPYHDVPRRVFAEQYLENEDGSQAMDFKFFCFHGEVHLILVSTNHANHHSGNYTYKPDFSLFPIYKSKLKVPDDPGLARPPHYDEMIEIARKLSSGFVHMRVDLYDIPQGVKFGEITLHSSSGLSTTMTERGEIYLGELLRLEEVK